MAKNRLQPSPPTAPVDPAGSGVAPEDRIGERIVDARKRAGMNQSELSRAADLPRTVLAGYEKGRYKPGARELRKLSDALKTTPTELIYGTAQPFAASSPLDQIPGVPPGSSSLVALTILVTMLDHDEQAAIMLLARRLAERRRGQKNIAKFVATGLPHMEAAFAAQAPAIEQVADIAAASVKKGLRKATASAKRR